MLEEDVYAGAIESIVERDFFPHLPKLQNQLEWLQAVQSGDPGLIKRAQLNIARRRAGLRTPLAHEGSGSGGAPGTAAVTPGTGLLATPGMTPALVGGATPALPGLRTPAGPAAAAALQQQQGLDAVSAQQAVGARAPGLGLDAFLAACEGEDNASFGALHESSLARKRAKMAHHLTDKNKPRLLEAGGHSTDEYGSTGQAPSTVLSARHVPKNALFYDSSQQAQLALSAAEKAAIVAGPPKAICHRATRSLQDDGVDGDGSAAAGPGAAGGGGQQQAAGSNAGTHGYGYMRTPQIMPGVGASPLMTWGDIASTPLRLAGDGGAAAGLDPLAGLGLGLDEYDEDDAAAAAAGRQFTLPQVRAREARAQQMTAARAARRHGPGRPSAGTPLLNSLRRGGAVGTPGGATPQLSAAALKLAQQRRRAGTGQRPGTGDATGDDSLQRVLRATYAAGRPTPSRQHTPAAAAGVSWDAPTPNRSSMRPGGTSSLRVVPRAPSAAAAAAASAAPSVKKAGADITDNLLQLK